MTIFIRDDELIVGNHASRQRWAPLFPETGRLPKEELDLFPIRKVDTLQISEEDKRYLLEDVYPYWKNKCTGDISRHYFPDEILDVLDAPHKVFDPMSRTRSGYGHYIQNTGKIINKGFADVEAKVKAQLAQLSYYDTDRTDKMLFYNAVVIICQAVERFAKRFAALAYDMAARESDPRRRRELELIGSVCEVVPYNPAQNLHQALQSYWFTLLIDYIFQNGSAISTGRFDQYIYPYYQKDIEEGRLTKEEAQEFIEALFVKHSDIIKASTFSSAKNNGGFATTVHLNLGGVDKDGNDATNELSYLCLEADKNVFNCEPNIGLRVNTATPDDLLMKVIDLLVEKEGGKMPLYNDNAIIPALCADGAPLELARDYGLVGCVEPTPAGNCMGITNACYFNIAKCLELALNDGVCMLSGKKLGLRTGDPGGFSTIEDVIIAFEAQTKHFIRLMIGSLNIIEQIVAEYTPHIYPSLLLDGCIESGKDAAAGGALLNYIGVQGVGMPDAADSLTAIRRLVFEEQRFTLEEVVAAMKSDFESCEPLRQMLVNHAPKYGNDIDEADEMAMYVSKLYCSEVKKGRDWRGGKYRAGLFCLSSNTPMGRATAAMASGRKSGVPLADGGISPKHGMDTKGPTAVCKSVAKIDHSLAANGVNLNQKILPSVLKTKEDREKLLQLIKGYFAMGGFHIQFNILTGETLKKAQQNPEEFRSLVVRVAGYSAFFVELDKDIQDEIISRTVQAAI
jgi:formate C-acetyltransferase